MLELLFLLLGYLFNKVIFGAVVICVTLCFFLNCFFRRPTAQSLPPQPEPEAVPEPSHAYLEGTLVPRFPLSFFAAESIGGAAIYRLRRAGYDVTRVYEAGLHDLPLTAQLDFAGCSRRVILTHDRDFLSLHEQGETAHAGILHLLKPVEPEELIKIVRNISERAEDTHARSSAADHRSTDDDYWGDEEEYFTAHQ